MSLQTIVSREIKLIDEAAVVTIGSIHGGNRSNIIPSEVELVGTIRTLNKAARDHMYEALPRKVKGIADSMRRDEVAWCVGFAIGSPPRIIPPACTITYGQLGTVAEIRDVSHVE